MKAPFPLTLLICLFAAAGTLLAAALPGCESASSSAAKPAWKPTASWKLLQTMPSDGIYLVTYEGAEYIVAANDYAHGTALAICPHNPPAEPE